MVKKSSAPVKGKASAKKVLKKPASKKATPAQSEPAEPRLVENMATFDLKEFLHEMQTVLGCAPCADKVVLATACSGLGVPAAVLRSIMGDAAKVVEITASEISETSAHALLQNCPKGHQPLQLLRNVVDAASSGKSFCYIANKVTPMNELFGSEGTDIYVAGYPCNDNSSMNTSRFDPQKDATTTPFAAVLPAVVHVLDKLAPKAFLLENVPGLLKKRSGQSPSSAEPVMSWVEDKLKSKLGNRYSWFSLMLPSDPLPTRRDRIFTIGLRKDIACHPGQLTGLQSDINKLVSAASAMPVHHVSGFLHVDPAPNDAQQTGCEPGGDADDGDEDMVATGYVDAQQGNYAVCFEKAVHRAVQAGRVSKDSPLLLPHISRMSASMPHETAWMRAQIDVYQLIIAHMKEGLHPDVADSLHAVADVGQSAERGHVHLHGDLPCLTTSSRLFDYQSRRFLLPAELAASMGMGRVDFRGLTLSQSSAILGKSMATTTLAILFLPLLKCLQMCQEA
ncbi:unnamed protein product [Symbiodinium sp. CCMP2592]|nr:unnamed protein product [Symbiodinium sp. CCMP2592]